ncbi:hypothetical protein DYB37_005654 [Aphanomyces astaci]|uniref:Glycoside hydrolase family 5 domain-containing protein n=1 Tax=Aphanomyces astaci TaxID=112090 RepID=A0A3R6YVD7_APHAT|nr:hypothetical protein DYB37_005654 [Aphanomyces astaci]
MTMSCREVSRDSTEDDSIHTDFTSHGHHMEVWRQSLDIRHSLGQLSADRRSSSSMIQSRREPRDLMLFVGKPAENERQTHYKGRLRMWPGLLLLLLVVGGAIAGITLGVKSSHEASRKRAIDVLLAERARRAIDSGVEDSSSSLPIDRDPDDNQVGNPKTYVNQRCSMLNYVSKTGRVFAVLPNNTETQIDMKGINWFGMETGNAIPLGLWTNENNGTTAYEIATYLAANKFNVVRLPVCIAHILADTAPRKGLVNLKENRAVDISSYMAALESIIKALAYRNIGVLISLHTLTPQVSGGTWFDDSVGITKDKFLLSVDILTKALCKSDYWNVVGLDLKNEPHTATWANFSDGAETIGNRMHAGCTNWLAFVEGTNIEKHSTVIGGGVTAYSDWWGGGLQGVKTKRVMLDLPNKVVYAPHYYNSGVYPQTYLYAPGGDELSDADLRQRISETATDMFGFIAADKKEALVLGEFAGLYATDAHRFKTTKRTTDFLIEVMLRDGYAGGFVWSLNPESAYQYNPNGPGTWTEGLLKDDWRSSNTEFVQGMAALDKLPSLKALPCVHTTPSAP